MNQATIYDNQHFGSYVAVVEQFINAKTDYTAGGVRPPLFPARTGSCSALARYAQDLLAVAWLSSDGTSQTHGDGLLAVGGTDTNVSVISMASSSVVALLKGHTNVRRTARGVRLVLTLLPRRFRISWTLQPPARSASLTYLCERPFLGSTSELTCLRMRRRTHLLASVSKDGTVRRVQYR